MYNSKRQCIEVIMRLQKLSCPNVQCVPESCIKVNSTHKKSCTLLWKEQYITCLYIVHLRHTRLFFVLQWTPQTFNHHLRTDQEVSYPQWSQKLFQVVLEFLLFTLFAWLYFPINTRKYLLYSFYKIKTKYLLLFGQNPTKSEQPLNEVRVP